MDRNDSLDIILFDTEENFLNLLPLTFTRPIALLRVGILTIREKWERRLGRDVNVKTADYMNEFFHRESGADTIYVASNVLPDDALVNAVKALGPGEALTAEDGRVIAYAGNSDDLQNRRFAKETTLEGYAFINYVFDIFLQNQKEIEADYRLLTAGRKSCPLSTSNKVIGPYVGADGLPLIFLEEGAKAEGAIFNTTAGPIYIGAGAEVMEGSCLRGSVALCANAKVKMGAKIYGATTLGPYCKVGGELSNVVMIGYSNKAHDGYLGNAVIGEWCNIGAGVNASNLKNDYSKIRIWNYASRSFMRTDLQFCGLIMGDHSKAGVNCMFNTATVLGVGVNIHGSGFPRVFVPSFSEGSAAGGFGDVSLKKFFDIAERVMGRREKRIGERERKIYEHIYAVSQTHKGGGK